MKLNNEMKGDIQNMNDFSYHVFSNGRREGKIEGRKEGRNEGRILGRNEGALLEKINIFPKLINELHMNQEEALSFLDIQNNERSHFLYELQKNHH